MSPIIFLNSMFKRKPIILNNYGNHSRDFTYVDDVSKNNLFANKKTSKKSVPYQMLNIGSGKKQN